LKEINHLIPPVEPVLKYRDKEPCKHKGCQHHISHPCEECGRTGAEGEVWTEKGLFIDIFV